MRKLFIALLVLSSALLSAQQLKELSHNDYDQWQKVSGQKISRNGQVVVYDVEAQYGDGYLEVRNMKNNRKYNYNRAYNSEISYGSQFVSFLVKAPHELIRSEKRKGKKDLELTQDSLKVFSVKHGSVIFSDERVKSYKFPEKAENFIAYEKAGSDKDEKTFTLGLFNLNSKKSISINHVKEYEFDRLGEKLYLIREAADSVLKTGVYSYDLSTSKIEVIDTGYVTYKHIAPLDKWKLAFVASKDSLKADKRTFVLKYKNRRNRYQLDENSFGIKKGWEVSEFKKPFFSDNGYRLFFWLRPGTELIVEDTTKLDDEKAQVDVWSWKDSDLQTVQKANDKKIKEKSYLAVYHINANKIVQLGDELVDEVVMDKKNNMLQAIGYSDAKYKWQKSFDYPWKKDLYSINLNNGLKRKVFEGIADDAKLSPWGRYAAVYSRADSSWYSVDLQGGRKYRLSRNSDKSKFYDDENDVPSAAGPNAKVFWDPKEDFVVVNDKYDLWRFHTRAEKSPVNITNYYGYKNKVQLRYIDYDKENEFLPLDYVFHLKGFYEQDKKYGLFVADVHQSNPVLRFKGDIMINAEQKAEKDASYIYTIESFTESPNLYYAKGDNWYSTRLTEINPQQKDFKWGKVELFKWKSFNHKKLEGLVYYPHNFDPSKKYPTVVYFYEIYSDRKNKYYAPSPSRSIVNFSYLTSNDYIVFVPDIKYGTGTPGQDAYDCVVSGVEALEREGYVDSDNIAIQGQSWGGYQVAYLITQTNKFKCAMAGAPVSNMTSAYGGIRWESGYSRQFQYERTQSRLGKNLWNGLDRYIDNSPVFMAPDVNTPLLMMHNDEDGAVPYYQGIEYYMALRRLSKPVWLLVYNNEAHNLKKRRNMNDLSIRMYQFFDHYLKGKPAPKWLVDGVPYKDKGKDFGYELIK